MKLPMLKHKVGGSVLVMFKILSILVFIFAVGWASIDDAYAAKGAKTESVESSVPVNNAEIMQETELESDSIFARAWRGGLVVFSILLNCFLGAYLDLMILLALSLELIMSRFHIL